MINEKLNTFQYGFRKDKSTIDCIIVLCSIIDKVIKYEKRKVYASFIDFQKCFEMLYRNGIWFKLIESGVSSKIVHMLQSMYSCVKSCVNHFPNVLIVTWVFNRVSHYLPYYLFSL